MPFHKVGFIVWLAFTGLHVLGHIREMPALLRADYGTSRELGGDTSGRAGRVMALGGALAGGLLLAVLAIPEFASWT